MSENKRRPLLYSFLRNVSKIQSFLCDVDDDYINIKTFPEIVSCLKEICDILEIKFPK